MAAIHSILVIEDDRFIGEMYVRSLRKNGYEVDWVVSGTEGYDTAVSKTYDLILLDIMLPGEEGSVVLGKLRGDGKDKIPQSRVIVLTNFEQDDESRMVMESRADGYLIKADITPRRLIEIISEMQTVE
jgi:DNA-binding response OmpR family regulator